MNEVDHESESRLFVKTALIYFFVLVLVFMLHLETFPDFRTIKLKKITGDGDARPTLNS